jgi:hypothetical protein
MKQQLFILFTCLAFGSLSAQSLTAPVAEGVFGGQVGDFDTWAYGSDSIYIVCATQSTNSLFWAKAKRNGARQNLAWQTVPSADADDGFGSSILNVEVHETSWNIFFLSNGKVYSTYIGSSSATLIDSMVKEFIIVGDTMALVKNNPMAGGQDVMDFGYITPATGSYVKVGSINLLKNYNEPPQMLIDPSDGHLHLFERGSSPHRYKLMDPFNAMSNSTSLTSAVNPSPIRPNIEWRTYGFDGSGTWYVAGQPPLNNPTMQDRRIAFSTDNGLTWNDTTINTPGPIGGVVGNNMVFQPYNSGLKTALYIGNAVEQDLSTWANWINPGALYIEDLNRANDGFSQMDPLDSDIIYHTTNIGFGYSSHQGDSIFGWNEGLTAVQVNDIDMTSDFATGFVASKSGIRKVENYNTSSPTWSPPVFPDFDGSPYTAVGMTAGMPDTVFVGNQRIYRSQNGGVQTSPMNDGWDQVFSPENPPLNFNRINTHCTAIAVAPDSANIVVAGFAIDFGDKGGCFYSTDGGNNWMQLLILSSSPGQDVDVSDVVISRESGNLVAYIGLQADPTTSGHYGVYRAVLGSTGFTVSADGPFGATDHTVDLELNNSGDSLFVLNRDPGLLPVSNVFIKDLSAGTWSNFSGPSAAGEATAITDGDGYVFVSLDETIYVNSNDGSLGWSLGYAYPVGTEINVLFYDELLVGTGTGLYSHDLNPDISLDEESFKPMHLFPNPANSHIYWEGKQKVKAFDLNGRLIYESAQAEESLNCQAWPEGVYLIRLANGLTEKIILRH